MFTNDWCAYVSCDKKKSKKIVKQMLYNTTIFEDMGFAYYGGFDGRDVET
ncbi:MAG: 1-deoxy-D-xylulose-5-phosphate synthase N-terminal domain-containing protein [Eubacteriales bacterium]